MDALDVSCKENAQALAAATCTTLILASTPAWAQDAAAADPNPGALTLTGSLDFLNQYMFRGIRQNSTGFAMWPAVDLGIAAYSGDGGLKSVGINFGTWNSLHTGDTGSGRPERQAVVRIRLLRDARFRLWRRHVAQHDLHRVHEPEQRLHHGQGNHVQVRASMTARSLGKGGGQTVHRDRAGVRYRHRHGPGRRWRRMLAPTWKSGFAPGYYGLSKASIAFPIKVGMSLSDYYEPLTGEDNKFGFFSIAGIVTVPLGGTTSFGGVEHSRRRRIPGAWRHHGVLQRWRKQPGRSVRSDSGSRTEPSRFGRPRMQRSGTAVRVAECLSCSWFWCQLATASPARAQGSADPNPGP